MTTYSTRVEQYTDILDLLQPGFLSHTVTVAGHTYSFRTLGPGDLFLLRSRTEGASDWRPWVLATSLWMVDGYNLLPHADGVNYAYDALRHVPPAMIRHLYAVQLGLRRRLDYAMEGVEAFGYEKASRSAWKTQRWGTAGVPGVESIGQNAVQRFWAELNSFEDIREEEDRQWDKFLLVAGVQAPKAVEKIRKSMDMRAGQDQARRVRLQETYYAYARGQISLEQYQNPDGVEGLQEQPMYLASKSADQLEHEFQMWVTGQKDEHDIKIDTYKQGLYARKAAVEEARKNAAALVRQEAERAEQEAEANGMGTRRLVGYTPEQLDQILGITPGRGGFARAIYEENQGDQVFQRWDRSEKERLGEH